MADLTIKQEKFAQKYVELGNASEAYRQAYDTEKAKPETIWNEAYKLMENPDVAARVNELKQLAAKRHEVTVDSLTDEYESIREAAFIEKQFSPAIAAVTGKAKLHGHLTDKPADTNITIAIQNNITPLDYARRTAFLLAKAQKELENDD
jgi:phage terminase small subunit